MQIAAKPSDENLRLKTLFSYDILDTDGEIVFDELTQLASEICDTPIALISLVDPDRQWFKAKVGLDVSETERDIAFCSHAILQQDLFEVRNALEDERFADNPLVTAGPEIRFYAGTQLVAPNGQPIGTLCAISDKPKKLTDKQKKALTILGREVIAQLELRKTMLSLVQANQNKTDFLSRISHEIRTPLNAIIGFSDILIERESDYNLPDEAAEYVRHISFSGKHLLSVINSVLDLNKIEAGKMELANEVVILDTFLRDIHGMLASEAKKSGIELRLDLADNLPATLSVDRSKLAEVLVNLMNNSIKFSDAGQHITVKVSLSSNQEICFEVIDEGIGISAADQAKLFSKYQQVGNHQRGGTGIGLCLCKGFIELMGGTLHVQSEEGKGTHIKFYLGQGAASTKITEQINPNKQLIASSLNVLIVEDNPLNQMVAQALFQSLGCIVTMAATGEEGVSLATEQAYECIFMDIQLPGISGYQALQQIRDAGVDTPIIALTADVFSSDYLKEGFDGFISKPMERQVLINVVNQTLQAHQ